MVAQVLWPFVLFLWSDQMVAEVSWSLVLFLLAGSGSSCATEKGCKGAQVLELVPPLGGSLGALLGRHQHLCGFSHVACRTRLQSRIHFHPFHRIGSLCDLGNSSLAAVEQATPEPRNDSWGGSSFSIRWNCIKINICIHICTHIYIHISNESILLGVLRSKWLVSHWYIRSSIRLLARHAIRFQLPGTEYCSGGELSNDRWSPFSTPSCEGFWSVNLVDRSISFIHLPLLSHKLTGLLSNFTISCRNSSTLQCDNHISIIFLEQWVFIASFSDLTCWISLSSSPCCIRTYWGSMDLTILFSILILVEYEYDASKMIPRQNDTISIWYEHGIKIYRYFF